MKDMGGRTVTGNSIVRLSGGGNWDGFQAVVHSIADSTHLWLTPSSDRPDGNGRNKFRWPAKSLTVIN
jgi:hypothetical protein